MVEAALVTPVVFALLFGIAEMGMLFKDYQAVGSMVRTGVRTASAMPRNAGFADATKNKIVQSGSAMPFANVEELWVYKSNPTNTFPFGMSNFSSCPIATCVKYQWSAGSGTFTKIPGWNWDSTTQNACARSAGGPPDRIGVYVKAKHAPFSGIIPTIRIAESSALYLEPYPSLQGCS